jgi:NADPH2:quinone reductase
MKAVLCRTLGGPSSLVLEEIPMPEPQPGEVLIRVRAAALNFLDTLILRGKYQFKPELPFSPGSEIAGVVEKLGDGVTDLAPGDRVMGYARFNGCREYTVLPARGLLKIPDGVSDEAASGLTITYGTAIHGLKDRGRLKAGETLAVLGASGGAGLAAVEIGKALGARAIACASSAEKLEICRQHGADALVNYDSDDLKDALRAATGGNGPDVIYDCVGDRYAEPALRSIAWGGRYLVIGFAAGEIPRIPLNLLLLKGCEMAGVFFGRFSELDPAAHAANMQQLLAWCQDGTLKPHIGKVFPLEETAQAVTMLEARKAVGKIVVRPGG